MKTILPLILSILSVTAGAQKAPTQKLDSVIHQKWDYRAERFYLDTKFVYTYDSQGDVIRFNCYLFDSVKQWINFYRDEFAFDSSRNNISDIYSSYQDSTGKWIVNSKTENTYSSSNLKVSSLLVWSEALTPLQVDSSKTEYTYDENGNLTLRKTRVRVAGASQWEDNDQIRYFYDRQGEVTSEMDYFWDITTNRLVNSHNADYTYDVNGKKILEVNYQWDPMNDTLFPSSKIEYLYDASGNRILTTPYFWNEGNGWVIGMRQKTDYTYDAGGHPLLEVGSNFDVAASHWYVWKRVESTYDAQGNLVSNYLYYGKEPTNNFRFYNSKSFYYYSDLIVSSAPEATLDEIQVYPNPNYGKFTVNSGISTSSIEIYDILGKKVYSDSNPTPPILKEIDISAQAKGIYFLKIRAGNRVQTSKIVIR